MTRSSRILLSLLGLLVLAFALLSLDWRPKRKELPPELVRRVQLEGPLRAGAGKATLVPPFPTPIGGFSTRGDAPFQQVLDPLAARALVVEVGGRKVAFASAELVVLPRALREKALGQLSDLGLEEFYVAATHTHSGPGGYWDRSIAEWIGLGHYDEKIEAFVAGQIAQAVRDAAGRLAPARLSSAVIDASHYGANRTNPGGPVDDRLTAVKLTTESGEPLGRLVVFAAHPTIVHRDAMVLSGDWPGALMRALEEGGAPTLFWQGAVGDTTWAKRQGNMPLEERVERFGQAIAADARGALAAAGEGADRVRFVSARMRVQVPPADAGGSVWGPFEPAASNLLQWLVWPGTTEVSYVQLGALKLALVPGEVVAELSGDWTKALGGASMANLVDDYIGYVDTPERIEAETGEAQRSYFGPRLAPVLLEGLLAAQAECEKP